ncbi:MAG TPA: cobalamin biosynthesis protein [Methanothermobacter sp.]|nr:cobalamin biosynthesis protein [Methanothermobacter sp.]
MEKIILIIILASFCIDLLFGEFPSPIHPVVWMGKLIERMKNLFFQDSKYIDIISGVLITISLIIIFVLLFTIILIFSSFNLILFLITASLLLSSTFSVKILLQSAMEVASDLDEDIDKGRKSLSFLVSRKTSKLSLQEIVSATIETLTENVVDSVVSPIFYCIIVFFLFMFLFPNSSPFFIKIGLTSTYQILVISAIAASVSYRVVNTLDAMVGYKDSTNINIGCFPAKLDDVLNFIPARITSMLIVLAAFILSFDYEQSWKIILKDANSTPSPNSGYPMAAAAGALNIQLNKPGTYKLGESEKCLTINEIKLAIKLSFVTIILFLVGITLFFIIIAYW